MGDPESVIDLDLHPDSRTPDGWDVLESGSRQSGRQAIAGWWRAARDRRSARWSRDRRWLAAAVAGGVALAVGGAAVPPGPALDEIVILNRVSEMTWHRDGRLIAMGAGKVTAYDPDTGAILWTVSLPEASMNVEVAGPWLLINRPEQDPARPDGLGNGRIEAHDLTTGKVHPPDLTGWSRTFDPDLLVLYDDPDPDSGRALSLRFHDLRSLDLLWSHSGPRPRAWEVSQDGRILYTLADDGLLEEIDARTGSRLRGVRLTIPKSDWTYLAAHDRRLWLQSGDSPAEDVHETSKIVSEQWVDRATLQVSPADAYLLRTGCGEMLCGLTQGADVFAVTVLDPKTEETLWKLADSSELAVSPAGLVRTTAFSRFVEGSRSTLLGLADPRTGAVRVPMPEGWTMIPEAAGMNDRILMSGRYALTLPDPAARHSFLGEITPDGLRPLGPLGFAAEHCESFSTYLLCRDLVGGAHLLRVTR
jgi:hypothetical protein